MSVMEVTDPDIQKYGVVVPGAEPNSVAGLSKNLNWTKYLQILLALADMF